MPEACLTALGRVTPPTGRTTRALVANSAQLAVTQSEPLCPPSPHPATLPSAADAAAATAQPAQAAVLAGLGTSGGASDSELDSDAAATAAGVPGE